MKNKEDFTSFIPLISAGLIFLGASRLMIYYASFGLDILNFIEFSEILSSFFNRLLLTSTVCCFILSSDRFQLFYTFFKKSEDQDSEQGWRKRNLVVVLFFWFVVSSYNIVLSLVEETFNREVLLATLILLAGAMMFANTTPRGYYNYKQDAFTFYQLRFIQITSIFFTCITVTLYVTMLEINEVKVGKKFVGTTIVFDNKKVFSSDSSLYYIGNTKGFLFLYQERTSKVTCVPMNRVLEISFKRKK